MEARYSFVFVPTCWENTFSFFRQKSINRAAVTELKPLIENQLVSYREVEFNETSLIAYPWYARRSRPGRRSVANRSQSITGQSKVGGKCITAVGPWS